jgi:hypothetical protein
MPSTDQKGVIGCQTGTRPHFSHKAGGSAFAEAEVNQAKLEGINAPTVELTRACDREFFAAIGTIGFLKR